MTCSGLHCAGCAGGASVPVAALAACCGVVWVAGHIVEVAIVAAVCGALAVAVVAALMRWCDRREARHVAQASLWTARAECIETGAPLHHVTSASPAVVNFNFYGADGDLAASVIRQAIHERSQDADTEDR